MRRENRGVGILLLATFAVCGATALSAQSLAELARQTRARAAQEKQTGRVFTNENVATSAPSAPAPAAAAPSGAAPAPAATPGQAGAAPAAPGQQPGQPADASKTEPPKEKSEAELEKEYREKFAKLREALSFEEKKLDVMQRELNLMQNQFYTNPQDTLMQETTRSNINQRMQEIEAQKASVEKARQAIAALEEELRTKGLPAGWAR